MPPRVRDKEIKTRRLRASCRSIVGGLVFMVSGLITFSGGLENIIFCEVKEKLFVLFLVQDILLVICGIFTLFFGIVYGLLGICQTNVCIRNVFRIGRRTLLHISHILILPALINVTIGIVGQILYHRALPSTFPHTDVPINPQSIWLGFDQSTYKVIFMIYSYTSGVACVLLYWISVFRSSTFFFLLRKGEETKALQYIHDLKNEEPKISLICTSYHVEVMGYSSAEKRIETSKEIRRWNIQQCFDASGPFKIRRKNLFLQCVGLRYVKLRLSWCYVWDRPAVQTDFEKDCQLFISQKRKDDDHAVLEVQSELNQFENHVMIRLTDSDPFWANLPVYIISSIFGCSLLYRHLFDSICAEREFKFIKRISNDEVLDRNKVYDQNEEFSDSMKAIMNECPSSIIVSDLPFFTPIPDPFVEEVVSPDDPNNVSEENLRLLDEMSSTRKREKLKQVHVTKEEEKKKKFKPNFGKLDTIEKPETPIPIQSDQRSMLSSFYDTFQHPISAVRTVQRNDLIDDENEHDDEDTGDDEFVNRNLFDEDL